MFGGGFGGDMFGDDPFFNPNAGQQRHDQGRGSRRGNNGQLARQEDVRRQDPFEMMNQMMGGMGMMSMGMGSGMRGMGMMQPFGGEDPFGSFGMMNMDDMARGSGGNGQFFCQTMSMSTQMGPDGKMHTEKFASSSQGDASKKIHQREQMYSNSQTGIDKKSLERQMANRGRKVVYEKERNTGEEKQTNMFHGMEEDEGEAFDQQWQRDAAPHMQNMRQQQQSLQNGMMNFQSQSQGLGGRTRSRLTNGQHQQQQGEQLAIEGGDSHYQPRPSRRQHRQNQ